MWAKVRHERARRDPYFSPIPARSGLEPRDELRLSHAGLFKSRRSAFVSRHVGPRRGASTWDRGRPAVERGQDALDPGASARNSPPRPTFEEPCIPAQAGIQGFYRNRQTVRVSSHRRPGHRIPAAMDRYPRSGGQEMDGAMRPADVSSDDFVPRTGPGPTRNVSRSRMNAGSRSRRAR